MEESDEPDQPISAGRQEIRKRRRLSQSMVDKSQQTEVTEKKKHLPISQSSGPKSTVSIGNIPGSKVNYESLRVSSQLQQTWTKRKHVQDMTDKSLQTEAIVEEKKEEIRSVGETVVPEEKPAAVGAAVPEFPETVQEVEIPPSRHSIQLKIDRSQQTSCTGDWSMMNIPQKEKVDKEQQTYFSETEIVVIGQPDSSFSKSNEVVQKSESSGKLFISEYPELLPSTSRDEEIRRISISKFLFSQQSKKGSLELSEDEQYVLGDVSPTAEEIFAEVQSLPDETTAENFPTEPQPPPIEEAPTEEGLATIEPTLSEEALSEGPPVEVQSPKVEEAPVEVQIFPAEEISTEEAPAKVESIPAKEAFLEEVYPEVQLTTAEEPPMRETEEFQPLLAETSPEVQPPPAEKAPAEEASDEVQPPLAETSPEVQLPPSEKAPADETSDEVQPPPAETSSEVQPPPAEKAPAEEASDKVQPPPAEKAPADETSDEVQSPPAEKAPAEEAPDEFQPPPAEKAPADETSDEVQSPPAETAPEVQPPPAEKAPAEEAPDEVQPPPSEKAPADETSDEVQPPPAEKAPAEEAPDEVQPPPAETSPEIQPPPSEKAPADEPSDEIQHAPAETSPEVEPPSAEEVPAEEAPIDVQSPPAETSPEVHSPLLEEAPVEEAAVEICSTPPEEAPKEDTSARVWSEPAGVALVEPQHPSAEETTLEMVPVDKQFPAAEEDFFTQISVEDVLAEVQPPPSEHTAADEPLVDHMSTEYQHLQTADVPVVKLESLVLEDQQKPEEPLELDPVPEDLSNIKKEQAPAFEIEGVFHIEIK
ncbi:fibrous sheath CABYR-binding protein isoform X29 [Canis lupus dingo]|uniref:fibrous sheath CABYR-binding protein isoform X28 n=1 Tax=Canis lupus dingo TaxID=286419 RepID=UPI0020C20DB8|nr:fibrous sheath CABYR-binding protein isoform X28 [Canis lupus dingo]XP_048969078.1 fibrous sheath CABYR-binding protein isoform X29 [Canis lupus dingo]